MMHIVAGKLALEYEFSDDPHDDFGSLHIWIENESFKLKNSFWVQWQDIVELRDKLNQPFGDFKKITSDWGHFRKDNHQSIINLEVEAINNQRCFQVTLEVNDVDNKEEYGKTHIHVFQNDVDSFIIEIDSIMNKKQNTATLKTDLDYR